MEIKVLRNKDVKRVLLGVPQGHQHLRLLLETEGMGLILQEATLANLMRAYIGIKTHPQRRALELVLQEVEVRKEGYARFQLLETGREDGEIEDELGRLELIIGP